MNWIILIWLKNSPFSWTSFPPAPFTMQLHKQHREGGGRDFLRNTVSGCAIGPEKSLTEHCTRKTRAKNSRNERLVHMQVDIQSKSQCWDLLCTLLCTAELTEPLNKLLGSPPPHQHTVQTYQLEKEQGHRLSSLCQENLCTLLGGQTRTCKLSDSAILKGTGRQAERMRSAYSW